MINIEKFKEEIKDVIFTAGYTTPIVLKDGTVSKCGYENCSECIFTTLEDGFCHSEEFVEWCLEGEPETPKEEFVDCFSCENDGICCEGCKHNYEDYYEPHKLDNTYMNWFLQIFPNALITDEGYPSVRPCELEKELCDKCLEDCPTCRENYWKAEVICCGGPLDTAEEIEENLKAAKERMAERLKEIEGERDAKDKD